MTSADLLIQLQPLNESKLFSEPPVRCDEAVVIPLWPQILGPTLTRREVACYWNANQVWDTQRMRWNTGRRSRVWIQITNWSVKCLIHYWWDASRRFREVAGCRLWLLNRRWIYSFVGLARFFCTVGTVLSLVSLFLLIPSPDLFLLLFYLFLFPSSLLLSLFPPSLSPSFLHHSFLFVSFFLLLLFYLFLSFISLPFILVTFSCSFFKFNFFHCPLYFLTPFVSTFALLTTSLLVSSLPLFLLSNSLFAYLILTSFFP